MPAAAGKHATHRSLIRYQAVVFDKNACGECDSGATPGHGRTSTRQDRAAHGFLGGMSDSGHRALEVHEITFDARRPHALAAFWAALVEREIRPGDMPQDDSVLACRSESPRLPRAFKHEGIFLRLARGVLT